MSHVQPMDVRIIARADRAPLIRQALDRLEVGQALEVLDDYDPQPLMYELAIERAGEFHCELQRPNMELWRLRLERITAPKNCDS